MTAPTIGMMMSATSELTIAPKAAPMITPTARSTTLPRIANFLNSSSIVTSLKRPAKGLTRFGRGMRPNGLPSDGPKNVAGFNGQN